MSSELHDAIVEHYAAKKTEGQGQQEFDWITVHPNGPGTKGTPVMVDKKSGEVKAGAGGKLDGQKLGKGKKGNFLDNYPSLEEGKNQKGPDPDQVPKSLTTSAQEQAQKERDRHGGVFPGKNTRDGRDLDAPKNQENPQQREAAINKGMQRLKRVGHITTPAQAEQQALDGFSELSNQERAQFSGPKEYASAVGKQFASQRDGEKPSPGSKSKKAKKTPAKEHPQFKDPESIKMDSRGGASLSDHDSLAIDVQDAHRHHERAKSDLKEITKQISDYGAHDDTKWQRHKSEAEREVAKTERAKVRAFNKWKKHIDSQADEDGYTEEQPRTPEEKKQMRENAIKHWEEATGKTSFANKDKAGPYELGKEYRGYVPLFQSEVDELNARHAKKQELNRQHMQIMKDQEDQLQKENPGEYAERWIHEDATVNDVHRALMENPERRDYHQIKRQSDDEAMKAFDQAAKKNPDFDPAELPIGEAENKRIQMLAEAVHEMFPERVPDFAKTHFRLGTSGIQEATLSNADAKDGDQPGLFEGEGKRAPTPKFKVAEKGKATAQNLLDGLNDHSDQMRLFGGAGIAEDQVMKGKDGKELFQVHDAIVEHYRAKNADASPGSDNPKTTRGTFGDIGHFVTIDGHPVFIKTGGEIGRGPRHLKGKNVSQVKGEKKVRKKRSKPSNESSTVAGKSTEGIKPAFVPRSKLDHHIIQAIEGQGTGAGGAVTPEDAKYFKDVLDDAYQMVSREAEEVNDDLRNLLAQFGHTGKRVNGFQATARRAADGNAIPGFDEMVDFARRHYPSILAMDGSESTGAGDHETALLNRIRQGFDKKLPKTHPEVMRIAGDMYRQTSPDSSDSGPGYDENQFIGGRVAIDDEDPFSDYVPFSAEFVPATVESIA